MRRIGTHCLLLIAATGCSNATEPAAPPPSGDAAPYAGCTPSPLALPLTETSRVGHLAVTVVEAAPLLPTKHANAWTVEVDGAEVASAETYMPVHGHPGDPAPTVERAGASSFRLALDFSMRGPWEVRVNLVTTGGESDQAVFEVCVTE